MSGTPKIYSIDPELEAALLAAAASGQPVRVKGKSTHLVRLDQADIWADYEPEALLRVVRKSADNPYSADPSDLVDLLADLRAAREQDSVGRPAQK